MNPSPLPVSRTFGRKIANMGLLCAILVVCKHVYYPEDPPFWFVRWMGNGFGKLGVPFFFAVSGFFLVNRVDCPGWYGQALSKRLKTLAIPYLALNLFWFFANGAIYWAGLRFSHSEVHPGLEITWSNFLRGMNPFQFIRTGLPSLAVLWYVKALMFLVVLSPLFVWMLGRSRRSAGIALALFFIMWTLQETLSALWPERAGWFRYPMDFYNVFFFAAGMALRFWGPFGLSAPVSVLSGLLGLACMAVHVEFASACPVAALLAEAASWPLLLAGLWHWIPSNPWPAWLVANTFPLYVIHTMIRRVATVTLKGCGLHGHPTSTPAAFFWVAALVVASCLLACFIKKRFPGTAAFFFGGR
jgi:peptidoglycan/LPS O-acetylase OafA/YrhL